MEVYENLYILWPIMESMVALDSMALRTGFADVPTSTYPVEDLDIRCERLAVRHTCFCVAVQDFVYIQCCMY